MSFQFLVFSVTVAYSLNKYANDALTAIVPIMCQLVFTLVVGMISRQLYVCDSKNIEGCYFGKICLISSFVFFPIAGIYLLSVVTKYSF